MSRAGWHTTTIRSFAWPETADLGGLACTSPDQCDAVGIYTPGKGIVPFVMTGLTSGQNPDLATLSMPAGTANVDTIDLACPSPGYCTVIGTYEAYQGKYPLFGFTAAESGGRWTAARTVALPAGSQGIQDLRGVACTTPGNCVAVGSALDSAFIPKPLVLTESDGTWGQPAYLSTPPDSDVKQGGDLTSVSCASAGSCAAAGDYAVKSGLVSWPMTIVESGGRWLRAQKVPLPADAVRTKKVGEGYLFSVSCGLVGTCMAVGEYAVTVAGADRGLAITVANGRLGQIAEMPQVLRTVSCVPAFCLASGYSGALISYSGGRWSQLGSIQPSASAVKAGQHDASLGGVHVACFADGRCVTISDFGAVNSPEYILMSTNN